MTILRREAALDEKADWLGAFKRSTKL